MYNHDVMKNQNLYRTQVLLEPEQYRELTRLAQEQGISLSALLRQVIAQALLDRQRRELARSAERLMPFYYSDGEITGYAALDGEDFPGQGG